jgi:hypothetical protein
MKSSRDKEEITSLRSEGAMRREREHKRRLGRMIPLLIFAGVGLLIAKQEIPAVDGWISRLLDAEAWQSGEACRNAARAGIQQSGFARLLDSGQVERTAAGFYVGEVQFAVLQPSGDEQHYRFSCNVTHAGEVVAIGRDTEGMNANITESTADVVNDAAPVIP